MILYLALLAAALAAAAVVLWLQARREPEETPRDWRKDALGEYEQAQASVPPLDRVVHALRPRLEAHGLAETGREWRPEVFGSGWALFEGRGRRLRVVWDGKEREAFLQVLDGQWRDLERAEARDPDAVARRFAARLDEVW